MLSWKCVAEFSEPGLPCPQGGPARPNHFVTRPFTGLQRLWKQIRASSLLLSGLRLSCSLLQPKWRTFLGQISVAFNNSMPATWERDFGGKQ